VNPDCDHDNLCHGCAEALNLHLERLRDGQDPGDLPYTCADNRRRIKLMLEAGFYRTQTVFEISRHMGLPEFWVADSIVKHLEAGSEPGAVFLHLEKEREKERAAARRKKRERKPSRRESKKRRFDVLQRDGHRCVYCGASPQERELHVDHVVPLSKGGSDTIENLATSCKRCNLGKGDRLLAAQERQL
jgi:5-methylcytosine-specific restriction endonuclease McrA